jgi:hypothetical protein
MEPRRVDGAQSRGEGSKWSHGGSWTLKIEAWRLVIEPWWVCMPVNSGLHQFDKEQDPDQEPHQSEKSNPDQMKGRIRIRIEVTRVRNSGTIGRILWWGGGDPG